MATTAQALPGHPTMNGTQMVGNAIYRYKTILGGDKSCTGSVLPIPVGGNCSSRRKFAGEKGPQSVDTSLTMCPKKTYVIAILATPHAHDKSRSVLTPFRGVK